VPAHVTAEARAVLERAHEILYLVAEPVAAAWIESVNPRSRSLAAFYEPGRDRRDTYAAIVEEVLARLREGGDVCFALYGHPGVFAASSHEAVRRASEEGFAARMLPAVSAEDCLFADLGIDPGTAGCQSYDSTELVRHGHRIDPTAALILWQPAVFGSAAYTPGGDFSRLPALVEYLERYYLPQHELVCYAASPYPVAKPMVERVQLSKLAGAAIPRLALLYVPPTTAELSSNRAAAAMFPFAR